VTPKIIQNESKALKRKKTQSKNKDKAAKTKLKLTKAIAQLVARKDKIEIKQKTRKIKTFIKDKNRQSRNH
jgi:hypothetical protein